MNENKPGLALKVVAVGGAGIKTLNRLLEMGLNGAESIAIDFDPQVLESSEAAVKLKLQSISPPIFSEFGEPARRRCQQSALAMREEIAKTLGQSDAVLIMSGMGGSTGTGVAPVVARIVNGSGVKTSGLVSLPFSFEGPRRREMAEAGARDLRSQVLVLKTLEADALLKSPKITRHTALDEIFCFLIDLMAEEAEKMLTPFLKSQSSWF